MVVIESQVADGRISRSDLQRHLRSRIAIAADILCSLSADDLKLFVTPLLINVKHINSCLHRTMIKRWMYGFQCNGVDAQTGCAMGALDLMQE